MAKLTAKQAGALLGVTDARVRQMVLEGKLPAGRFGKNLMIDEKDLALVGNRKPGPKPKTQNNGAARKAPGRKAKK
jgi:excisionase family DNA binding protein